MVRSKLRESSGATSEHIFRHEFETANLRAWNVVTILTLYAFGRPIAKRDSLMMR
jgi:hypothetical protein